MASIVDCKEKVTIEILDPQGPYDPVFEHPKVNAYIEERVNQLHSSISVMQYYNIQSKNWEAHHIISDPEIGKSVLKSFKFGNGEASPCFKDDDLKAELTSVLGAGSILTASTKEEHLKIQKVYRTFFSNIYKDDGFVEALQKNIEQYLLRYSNQETQISLSRLAGEIITVVMQNTVNGYSYDVHEPSYCIKKYLTPPKELLKPANEIGTVSPRETWLSKTSSYVAALAIPIFKSILIDRPAKNISDEGVTREKLFPNSLKKNGFSDKQILANVKTGFFAQETMSNFLTFLLYDHAKDLVMQEAERQAVLNFDYRFSYSSLPIEVEQHVLIGLHEYPTGGSTRKAAFPLKIHCPIEQRDHYVNAGDYLTYSPYAASHYPVPWQEHCKNKDGDGFDMGNLERLYHLPFGSKEHICPAHKFVVPVISLVLCKFLEHYRIQLTDPEQTCRPVIFHTLQMEKDILVTLTPKEGLIED